MKKTYHDKYTKRKLYFWILVFLSVVIICFISLFLSQANVKQRLIRVGICGAVHVPAVYTMREGSDLAMLVRKANGFKLNANVTKLNLEKIVKHDTIYHIPTSGKINNALSYKFIKEINKTIKSSFTDLTKQVVQESKEKEIKHYSILYVGLPAVYVLINYYPEFNRINFVHLPHSSVFLNNDYRLMDIFLTLGTYPTMRILEHSLKQKIDFFLIQDRTMFIDLIDMLSGVELKLDKHYAEAYDLNPGMSKVDGFHTWEYIRFLDWRNIEMKVVGDKKMNLVQQDNFKVAPRTWERIYEMRNQRQRYVLQGMRKSFRELSESNQIKVINNFKNVFQTDMSNEFLMSLYKDVLSTKDFNFGTIPGSYKSMGDNLYFYPDLPSFEMLRQNEIRNWLQKRSNKSQVVY